MRRWGWWLAGIAVLVLGPLTALGVAIARFDPNTLKPTLIAAVEGKTGRAFALNGDVRVLPSLWPTIEVNGATLANLPGGSRPDMARAERIAVELSLPALLQRRIEVTRLTLTGPNILFEQVKGKPNWRFDLPEQGEAPKAGASPFQLDISNAVIRNGMVTWHLPARTKVLGIRIMEIQHHSAAGPIEFGGTFVYADNQPFRLTGSMLPTAGLADPWTTRLDLNAFDTVASATGTMDTAGVYDMQVEASSGTVEALNALLPEMQLPAIHKAKLSTRLTNGKQPGDLPVVGATTLRFAEADLGVLVPGLTLGAFEVAIDKPGGTADLHGTGRFKGQGFVLAGKTGVPQYPDERFSVPIDLTLKSDGKAGPAAGSLALKGKVALRSLAFDGLDAMATLATPALSSLRTLVPADLPKLTGVQFNGHVVLPANRASIGFSAAKLASDQGDLAGDGSLGLGKAMVLGGRFRSTALDLDGMLAAFGIDLTPPEPGRGRGTTVIPDTPIDWSLLRGPALDLSAIAETVRFLGDTWHGVELGLQLKDGRLQRGTLSVASGGRPVSLSVTADANQAAVPVALTLAAPALPLALVARYAGLPGQVAGTARVSAQVQGRAHSLHDLAASLTGTVSLAAVGGQLSNAAFIQLTEASLQALNIRVPPEGQTALRCLGFAGTFKDGVGELSPIAMESTYLSLDGVGQVDFRRETLTLELKPLAALSGSTVAVPVVVQGPFRNLSGRLDANVFDKLGLLVDAWFGGDKSTACVDAGLLQPAAR